MQRRGKDAEWNVYDNQGNTSWEKVSIILLMDLRDELKALNRILGCANAIDIPNILRRIDVNTRKVKRSKKK